MNEWVLPERWACKPLTPMMGNGSGSYCPIVRALFHAPISAQIHIKLLLQKGPGLRISLSPAVLMWPCVPPKKHKPDSKIPCKATFLLMTLKETPDGVPHDKQRANYPPIPFSYVSPRSVHTAQQLPPGRRSMEFSLTHFPDQHERGLGMGHSKKKASPGQERCMCHNVLEINRLSP